MRVVTLVATSVSAPDVSPFDSVGAGSGGRKESTPMLLSRVKSWALHYSSIPGGLERRQLGAYLPGRGVQTKRAAVVGVCCEAMGVAELYTGGCLGVTHSSRPGANGLAAALPIAAVTAVVGQWCPGCALDLSLRPSLCSQPAG